MACWRSLWSLKIWSHIIPSFSSLSFVSSSLEELPYLSLSLPLSLCVCACSQRLELGLAPPGPGVVGTCELPLMSELGTDLQACGTAVLLISPIVSITSFFFSLMLFFYFDFIPIYVFFLVGRHIDVWKILQKFSQILLPVALKSQVPRGSLQAISETKLTSCFKELCADANSWKAISFKPERPERSPHSCLGTVCINHNSLTVGS